MTEGAGMQGSGDASVRPTSAPREQLAAAGESMKRFGGEAARWGNAVFGNLQDATHRALGSVGIPHWPNVLTLRLLDGCAWGLCCVKAPITFQHKYKGHMCFFVVFLMGQVV